MSAGQRAGEANTVGFPLPADARPAVRALFAPPPGAAMGGHYAGCFACGVEHPGGLNMSAVAGDGVSVRTRFVLSDAHQGAPRLAHGGIVAAFLDETLGYLLALQDRPGVTARLEISYRRPIPVGTTLHGEAWCTGVAGRKIFMAGYARADAEDGPIAAEASGLFVAVGPEHFTVHRPLPVIP